MAKEPDLVLGKRSWQVAVDAHADEPIPEWEKRSKSQMDVINVAYARYGMSYGVVDTRQQIQVDQKSAVLAKGWPSWVFAAKAAWWKIVMIILMDSEWLSLARSYFEGTEVRLFDELPEGYLWPAVDATFSDIDVGSKLNMWSTVSSFIVLTQSVRRKPSSWSVQTMRLNHVDCGGATNGCWIANVYMPTGSCRHDITLLGSMSPRDSSGVLSTTIGRGLSCPPVGSLE